MRLDFNILWVEDQANNVKAQEQAIGRRMRDEGFRLQVVFAKSVEEARPLLSSDIYGDHIDLILMDYNLGAGPKGDEGLRHVRDTFPYKDVVFYSAGAADLSDLVTNSQLAGVFCSTREDLPRTVIGLFDTLVKKVLDIDHARGIVMGASSDIDGLILDCLSAHFSAEQDSLSSDASTAIAKRLVEIRERFDRAAKAVEAATKVEHLRDHHQVYTSIDRLNLLRKLLEKHEAYAEMCAKMKAYANDTVPRRNILAHARVQRNGFSRKLFDKQGNELTREEARKIRLELLNHQEAFEKLLAELPSK